MRKNTVEKISEVESLGDKALSKETFDSCMYAIDCYLSAQAMIFDAYEDDSIDDGIDEKHFKTTDLDAKLWYMNIEKKLFSANELLANPKIAAK